jgi:hypothetical protein
MYSEIETFYSLGLDLRRFASCIDNHYVVQHRRSSRYQKWGPLLAANKPQARFVNTVMTALKRGGPVRIIVLKSRKVGVSTATGLIFYHLCTHIPGFTAGVMAHEEKSTGWLFSIVGSAHQQMPDDLRPDTRYGTRNEMTFGTKNLQARADGNHGMMSKYICATAGAKNPLSGTTLRALHMSECAKFPGDKLRQMRVIMSVMGAVPADGPSLVVAESTANGADGWFYHTWQRAEGNPDAGAEEDMLVDGVQWIPFFAPWYEDPGNAHEGNHIVRDWSNWAKEDREREDWLRREFKLTDGQLSFRRFKILNEANGDPEWFAQEYPTTAAEAFRLSGSPAFDRIDLDAQEAVANAGKPIIYKTNLIESQDEGFELPRCVGW